MQFAEKPSTNFGTNVGTTTTAATTNVGSKAQRVPQPAKPDAAKATAPGSPTHPKWSLASVEQALLKPPPASMLTPPSPPLQPQPSPEASVKPAGSATKYTDFIARTSTA